MEGPTIDELFTFPIMVKRSVGLSLVPEYVHTERSHANDTLVCVDGGCVAVVCGSTVDGGREKRTERVAW